MVLVGYSDSEESDAEGPTSRKSAKHDKGEKQLASGGEGFRKILDKSQPRKIHVSLPQNLNGSATNGENIDDPVDDPPAAKRARTTAPAGFNSFLPAPKHSSKLTSTGAESGQGSAPSKTRGVGIGIGVSLRTGAAPAFSRRREPNDEKGLRDSEGTSSSQASPAIDADALPFVSVADEVKIVGQATMFKPLSVARTLQKKKKPPLARQGSPAAPSRLIEKANHPQLIQNSSKDPEVKPKRSLFSTEEDISEGMAALPAGGVYEPVPTGASSESLSQELKCSAPEVVPAGSYTPNQTNRLETLANELALTPAQRRQLFGRSGKPSDAQVAHFSLSAEYKHNHTLIENQSTAPAYNPVRGIAAGKHSLQQLVNAASTQREALEESFATGRSNKKAAGSRYGW